MLAKYKIGMRNIKTAVAVAICLLFFELTGISDGIQAVVAAIICMKSSVENSVQTGIERIIGTIIGSITGVLAALLIDQIPISYEMIKILVVIVGIILLIYLCNIFDLQASIVIGVITYVFIIIDKQGTSPLIIGLVRLFETVFGIFVVYIINNFLTLKTFKRLLGKEIKKIDIPQIREYTDDDIGRIMFIWLRTNIRTHRYIKEAYWHKQYDSVRNTYLENANIKVYEKGQIMAYIAILDDTHIESLNVLPEYQNQGMASKLLEDAKENYNSLTINLYADNRNAIGFFVRRDFDIIDERVNEETQHTEYKLKWSVKH
jgi:ribosomal protein S18 acetylase RimI-like enzyme